MAANWNAKIIQGSIAVLKKADINVTASPNFINSDAKCILFPPPINLAAVIPMALKRPLCLYDGVPKEIAVGDTLLGNALVSREVPTGTKNGVNRLFYTAYNPLQGSEQVYVNGILQNYGALNDYVTVQAEFGGNFLVEIEFRIAPQATDIILVTYWR